MGSPSVKVCGKTECLFLPFLPYLVRDLFNAKWDNKKRGKPQTNILRQKHDQQIREVIRRTKAGM